MSISMAKPFDAMIGIAIGTFLLSTSAFAIGAPMGPVGAIEIVESGIYAAESESHPDLSDSEGSRHLDGPPALLKSTTTIPAELGREFGFIFKPVDMQEGIILDLTLVTEFPSEGLFDPATQQTVYRDERDFRSAMGLSGYQGYKLDSPHELVPGTWTFKILHGGELLASQSFTLVAPPQMDQ